MADLGAISKSGLAPVSFDGPNVTASVNGQISVASPRPILGGGAAVPGTLYLDNGRLKASLDGAPIAGGRLVAIET